MKTNIILALLLLILLGATAYLLFGGKKEAAVPLGPSPLEQAASSFTRESEENGVTIAVTPVDLSKDPLEFEVIMDTHSGSLDADLQKGAILRDADGKMYEPLKVEGDPPGGHHRSTVVTFRAPSSSQKLELIIRGVDGAPDRIFTWN